MLEIYHLDTDNLPTIPVPHDCVIDGITIEGSTIIFTFEQDISYHDSIKYINPDAQSLIIKYHLTDEWFSLYKWHKPIKFFADNGYYKIIDGNELFDLTSSKCRVEYINHYVAYRSIIIELFALTPIRLELTADRVEFYWK